MNNTVRRGLKTKFLKRHGNLAYWTFERDPSDMELRKQLVALARKELKFSKDNGTIYYRLGLVWTEHYREIVPDNKCPFDKDGVCTALGCFETRICGSRNKLGYPAYA